MERLIRYLLVAMTLSGCKPKIEHPQGLLQEREALWKTPVSVDRHLAHGIRMPPVVYAGGAIMGCATGFQPAGPAGPDRPGLIMLDIETGRKRWVWNDYMYDRESLFLTDRYVFRDRMVFHNGPRTYCIDLHTGETRWKKWKADSVNTLSASMITGLDDQYFFSARVMREDCVHYQPSKLYSGRVSAPVREALVVNPQLPREYSEITPILRGTSYFQTTVLDGDTVIAVAYQVPTVNADYNIIKSAFGLYNLSQQKWIYQDRILLEPQRSGVVDWCPVIYGEKIYWNANRDIICNDLRTGSEIWRKSFRQDFLFTPLIVEDSKVIVNNEDTWLYALNANTGAEIWKTPSAGTSSHLVRLDGYIYYIGGGDGFLHAVELSTGKRIWKLRSPDLRIDGRAHFSGAISGVPARGGRKGRVLVNTGLHVYCYEAIQ